MNSQKGIAALALIALVVIIAVGGAAVYFGGGGSHDRSGTEQGSNTATDTEDTTHTDGAVMEKEGGISMESGDAIETEKSGDAMADDAAMMETPSYTGTLLAGSKEQAPLLDFTKEDYDKAIASGKLVTLYFYATWCPTCRIEFPKMQSAFDGLSRSDVVGFRVNYNDSDTDAHEKALAREFGVAYQHTKVFVQNDERVLKSPESWSVNRYSSEIATYAN